MTQVHAQSAAAADDDTPVWGAAAIGRVVGLSPRKALHQLEAGNLPATKVGRLWASTRRQLRQRFQAKVS